MLGVTDILLSISTRKLEHHSWYSNLLQAGRSGDQILLGTRFSTLVQTGPGAHPASCTMSAGSFLGVKQQECGSNHLLLSSSEVKERVDLHLYSHFGFFMGGYGVKFTS
jgi:hypothetical protein